VLASLLPGLRDLRTPLATGYLWLVTLWLLVHEHLPTSAATASGPTKSSLQLADLVGKATVLAAFSFIAYLVGSILMLSLRPNFAAYVVDPENDMLGGFIGSTIIRVTHGALGTPSSGLTTSMYDQIRTFASSRLRENNVRLSTKQHADILRTRPSAATDDANTERHNKELLAGDYSGRYHQGSAFGCHPATGQEPRLLGHLRSAQRREPLQVWHCTAFGIPRHSVGMAIDILVAYFARCAWRTGGSGLSAFS